MAVLTSRQHFGDLLGSGNAGIERDILASFEDPLDRLILTADGTLQVLVSAWHNRIVQVTVRKHVPCYLSSTVDREIDLCFGDEPSSTFCNAKSKVVFENNVLLEKARAFGIGQLFREWNLLPRFQLLEAGKDGDGQGLWRKYLLLAPGIQCTIHETFPRNPLKLEQIPRMEAANNNDPVGPAKGLISDARFTERTPASLTNVQRIFCKANGNVQRLASALLGEQVDVRLQDEHHEGGGSFSRRVELAGSTSDVLVCIAKSKVVIENQRLLEQVLNAEVSLGSLIKTTGEYPQFELIEAQWKSTRHFNRTYAMKLQNANVTLTVQEEFYWPDEHKLGLLSDEL